MAGISAPGLMALYSASDSARVQQAMKIEAAEQILRPAPDAATSRVVENASVQITVVVK